MTESQHLPRRIAELALTIPEDMQRLADLVETERAANARVVEAEHALAVARSDAEQAGSERRTLERDINAVRDLLALGRERFGFNVAPLLAPPMPSLPMTPPVVRVADPSPDGPYCHGCRGELVQEGGKVLHARTRREECPPPVADEDATQVLVPVQPVPAARDDQDGSEER